ncbi:hypothetical protein [Novipirellula artificiosorum]|nr:hypothetical protein [Novipirellula artificiosorum]
MRNDKTRSDYHYLLLVAAPLVTLVTMFGIAIFSAWKSQRYCESGLQLVTGLERPMAPTALADWYDARSSKADTVKWQELEMASVAVNYLERVSNMNHRNRSLSWVPPGESSRTAERNERFATLVKPIVDQLKAMPEPGQPVWHPLDYDNLTLQSMPAPVSAVLMFEMSDAYHQGDTRRAIEAIRLGDQLLGPRSKTAIQIPQFHQQMVGRLIRLSLRDNLWSEPDLAEIQQLMSAQGDAEESWRNHVTMDALRVAPWLLDHYRGSRYRHYAHGTNPLSQDRSGEWRVVPSEAIGIVDQYTHAVQLEGQPGTADHSNSAARTLPSRFPRPWNDEPQKRFYFDQWLKMPYVDPNPDISSIGNNLPSFAQQLVDHTKDQRFTRTAIALKQYQMKFDRYPETLNELTKVGLPASAMLGSEGKPFYYRVEKQGESVTVGTLPYEIKIDPEKEAYRYHSMLLEL